MPVQRLNHAVLYVRDARTTARFYEEVLDFRVLHDLGHGAAVFLQAPGSSNDHDLGLFSLGDGASPSPAGRTAVGLYHLAWEVDTLDELSAVAERLRQRGALVGASDHGTTKALYAKDPDGLELEVCWLIPAGLITEADLRLRTEPLDLDAVRRRFGGVTEGGVGVSVAAHAV